MRYTEIIAVSALVASAAARPSLYNSPSARAHARDMKIKREVPQEQSHKKFLTKTQEMLLLNNPDQIVDSVFGLLGNAAAAQGIGSIADADCLQQATADQAFTNAVAAGDVDGQVAALIFRTLERNTGSVGLASVDCTAIQAVNPQIAALSQHQDPASDGAAQINKDIVLELAAQIAAVGGDPLQALESGTFQPGDVNDPTGAGNTCNDETDAEGCIFTENLLVPDASEEEILAAAGGAAVVDQEDNVEALENNVPANAEDVVNVNNDVAANAEGVVANAADVVVDDKNADDKNADKKEDDKKEDDKKEDDKKEDDKKEDDKKEDDKKEDDKKEDDKKEDDKKEDDKKDDDKKEDDKKEDDKKDDDKNDDDKNDDDKIFGNDDAKRFKQQASRGIDFNDRNLFADIGKNAQFVFGKDQFQQQLLQFQNIDAILIQQQFVQVIQQVQFNAWQQIAIQQFILEQQLQQHLIQQQVFLQQLAFFQQQIVQNVAIVVQQHVQILQQNVNIINLGGFDSIQQNFVQQLGGLGSFANLLNIGGGFDKYQNNVELQKLFGGVVGNGFY